MQCNVLIWAGGSKKMYRKTEIHLWDLHSLWNHLLIIQGLLKVKEKEQQCHLLGPSNPRILTIVPFYINYLLSTTEHGEDGYILFLQLVLSCHNPKNLETTFSLKSCQSQCKTLETLPSAAVSTIFDVQCLWIFADQANFENLRIFPTINFHGIF